MYTDSLLCLGKFHEHLHSIEARKPKLEWFMKSREYRELDGIDEEPVEFEWKKSQDTQHWSFFVRSKGRWQRTGSNLNCSKIESSSCRCATTSIGHKMATNKSVLRILYKFRRLQKYFLKDIGCSSDQEQKKNGMERTLTSQTVCGTALQR